MMDTTMTLVIFIFIGAFGAFCKAMASNSQDTWSRRTILDGIVGAGVGAFYPHIPKLLAPVPFIGGLLPDISSCSLSSLTQLGFVVWGSSYVAAHSIVNVLDKFDPTAHFIDTKFPSHHTPTPPAPTPTAMA